MPRKKLSFREDALTKMQLRKLNALRRSIGEDLGNDAFAKWYASQPTNGTAHEDRNVMLIQEALEPLVDKVRIPRGSAYAIRRGRGRFIVEPVELTG